QRPHTTTRWRLSRRGNFLPPPDPTPRRQPIARPTPSQPVKNPQPPLPIRQRDLTRTQNRPYRRARLAPLRQPPRQRRNARRLKQRADRKLDIKARPDPADQPRRQQRMTPKRKEIVVNADPRNPQPL